MSLHLFSWIQGSPCSSHITFFLGAGICDVKKETGSLEECGKKRLRKIEGPNELSSLCKEMTRYDDTFQ